MARGSALIGAVLFGRQDVVKVLSDHGADLNAASGKDGFTPLVIACHEEHMYIMFDLLKYGADPNKLGKEGIHVVMYFKAGVLNLLYAGTP